MIFYILFLFFISGLLSIEYFYPRKQKTLLFIVFSIIVLVVGFRDNVGNDYNRYVNWYLYKTRDDGLEFGFVAIMNLFRMLNLSPLFLFAFFSFFTCLFVFLGLRKYTVNANLALLFYIMIPSLYLGSFSYVRQSFAVSISFYAFYYLINKKYLFYFLLMFIGISVHNSCWIALIVFFLIFKYGRRIKISYLCGIVIISFLLSRFDFISIFRELFENTRYLYYFSNQVTQIDSFKIIIMNLEGSLILFYFYKLKDKYAYHQYLVVLYCFCIVLVNLFSKNSELSRISTYFRIFEIVILADLICLEKNRRRIFLLFFFFALYFSAFLNALKRDQEIKDEKTPRFIPYKNVLWPFNA